MHLTAGATSLNIGYSLLLTSKIKSVYKSKALAKTTNSDKLKFIQLQAVGTAH